MFDYVTIGLAAAAGTLVSGSATQVAPPSPPRGMCVLWSAVAGAGGAAAPPARAAITT